MASKNTTEVTATATFELFEEKKHSIRYNETGTNPPVLRSLYVAKEYLTEPWPQTLTVTIKSA